jgi:hypothetical protein
MTRDDDRTPLDDLAEAAADLFIYAPIGLFFEGPSVVTKLAEQGRVHARNARLFGEFAVRQGEGELRRRLGDLEGPAGGLLRLFGLVGDDDAPAPPPASPASGPAGAGPDGPDVSAAFEPTAGNGHAPAGPDVSELAIPDYDSLSASQVVTRLEGLSADELEAVRAYESAHRGRKTILNKVAQLQA